MAALALALTTRRFGMPPTRVRAGGVVEHQVTLGPPTTAQPAPLDPPQLEHDAAGQAGHRRRVGPLQALAEPDCTESFELDSSPAWLSERCDTRRLLFDVLTGQDSINEIQDGPVQLPQSLQF